MLYSYLHAAIILLILLIYNGESLIKQININLKLSGRIAMDIIFGETKKIIHFSGLGLVVQSQINFNQML